MANPIELTVKAMRTRQVAEDRFEVRFLTSAGTNRGIFHHTEGNTSGVIMVGGAGGGFDGPASVYRDLGPVLLEHAISTLRLDYRKANELEDCVLDVLVGIEYLKDQGIEDAGLVGWSFGGAVVITAGAESDAVQAVVTVASQTYGAGRVANLSPKALLLIHGTGDRTLPPSCSQDLYQRAREPKELVLYEGANHGIDQKREEMLGKIEGFLEGQLGRGG